MSEKHVRHEYEDDGWMQPRCAHCPFPKSDPIHTVSEDPQKVVVDPKWCGDRHSNSPYGCLIPKGHMEDHTDFHTTWCWPPRTSSQDLIKGLQSELTAAKQRIAELESDIDEEKGVNLKETNRLRDCISIAAENITALRLALNGMYRAALSWHKFHEHTDIQCDAICEAMKIAEPLVDKK